MATTPLLRTTATRAAEKPYENVMVVVSPPTSDGHEGEEEAGDTSRVLVPVGKDLRGSSSSTGEDSDHSRCPCCGEAYSPVLHQGRVLLSCLHHICSACVRLAADLLVSLRKEEDLASRGDLVLLGRLMCPFCHCRTQLKKKCAESVGESSARKDEEPLDCHSEGGSVVIGRKGERESTYALEKLKER